MGKRKYLLFDDVLEDKTGKLYNDTFKLLKLYYKGI